MKLIICCGTGGVGKTTVAAAMGLRAANQGRRVLILTVDPAQRLATVLGLKSWTDDEIEIQGLKIKGQLFVARVNPLKVFDRFVRQSTPSSELAESIFQNKIYQQVTTLLSGSQEFSSLEKLHQVTSSTRFDLVILDTPPAQNAVDFFRAPQKFFSLFQDSVVKWFLLNEKKKMGLFSSLIGRSTKVAVNILEGLTGKDFMEHLSGFFVAIKHLQPKIADHSLAIQKLFSKSSTGFILVTQFDGHKLREADRFERDLREDGFKLSAVVINRAYPSWLNLGQDSVSEVSAAVPGRDETEHKKTVDFWKVVRMYHKRLICEQQELSQRLGSQTIYQLKDRDAGLSGIADLENMSLELAQYQKINLNRHERA